MNLTPVIFVDEGKCVNCHACIVACPVKFCNDGTGNTVTINHDMCIGCGACIAVCHHDARIGMDDLEQFLKDIKRGTKMVAIVAPAVAASYPDEYLRINGWLKSLGVAAVFDVSFGAELTVKSYLEHIKNNQPECVIAQPCPVIVTYIQIYRPELLPYLSPAGSPMQHIMRAVKEFYPQYRDHKIVAISPCIAKRREFDDMNLGDYNVTLAHLQEYFEDRHISLQSFPHVDYDSPPAERGVLFPTPGGLLQTAMREVPGIAKKVRKIEGPHVLYPYLDTLPEMIQRGMNPLLVDCLNCELGCSGGTGTTCQHKPMDEVEYYVESRNREMQERYRMEMEDNEKHDKLHDVIDQYWKPGLYDRRYQDLRSNNRVKTPTQSQINEIYAKQLNKTCKEDELDCGCCGYHTCREMAVAMFNNLSVPQECSVYTQKILEKDKVEMEGHLKEVQAMQTTMSMYQKMMTDKVHTLLGQMGHSSDHLQSLSKITAAVSVITTLARQTNLLALNASIEAARAGQHGAGFAVVAQEVKSLADKSRVSSEEIAELVSETQTLVARSTDINDSIQNELNAIIEEMNKIDKQNAAENTSHGIPVPC